MHLPLPTVNSALVVTLVTKADFMTSFASSFVETSEQANCGDTSPKNSKAITSKILKKLIGNKTKPAQPCMLCAENCGLSSL